MVENDSNTITNYERCWYEGRKILTQGVNYITNEIKDAIRGEDW